MLELLTKEGMAHRIHDSSLTRKIAKKLKAKGYRVVRRGSRHVWTNDKIDKDVAAEKIVRGL